MASYPAAGSPAVSFDLADTEGVARRSADYAGSWLLLVFLRHLR
jgi:peroxiredoxin